MSAWRRQPAAVLFTHLVQIRHAILCFEGYYKVHIGKAGPLLHCIHVELGRQHKMASYDCLQMR